LVLYLAALGLSLGGRKAGDPRAARLAWTAGCLFYLLHVYAAFEHFHGWSHAAAYAETARQTSELFGIHWGGGLFFNYVFTLVWLADVVWWWRGVEVYASRPRWAAATIHVFLAFLFFNGAVVFASGFSRWAGLAAIPLLLLAWAKSRQSAVKEPSPKTRPARNRTPPAARP
jgi:hypothetical protein